MSRVITFSRTFPVSHPRKGEPTFFVEQLVNSFKNHGYSIEDIDELCHSAIPLDESIDSLKFHTIRKGNRWKVGDKFSPRVWSGKPYQSKMITIAEDIEIKKIWTYCILDGVFAFLDNIDLQVGDNHLIHSEIMKNDGMSESDFVEWFRLATKNQDFIGQIICWDESINY